VTSTKHKVQEREGGREGEEEGREMVEEHPHPSPMGPALSAL